MPYKLGTKEYMRQYRQRPYVKEKAKAYRSTEEYKERMRANRKRYEETHKEAVREKNARWNRTEKCHESKKAYRERKREERRRTFNLEDFAKNIYRHRAEITRRNKSKWTTGSEIISKEDFIAFCKDNEDELRTLWNNWKESGYQRKLTPSLDRIDNNKGYVKGNLQFLTLFQNQQKYWRGL